MYVLLKILMIIGYHYETELSHRSMKTIVIWNTDGKIAIEKKNCTLAQWWLFNDVPCYQDIVGLSSNKKLYRTIYIKYLFAGCNVKYVDILKLDHLKKKNKQKCNLRVIRHWFAKCISVINSVLFILQRMPV